MILSRDAACDAMNRLGREHTPFFFIISFDTQQNIVCPLDHVDTELCLYDFEGMSNVPLCVLERTHTRKNLEWSSTPVDASLYAQGFHYVVDHILRGNSYLANYTCATPIRCNYSLEELFYQSKARYKLLFRPQEQDCHAPDALDVPSSFVCFSPESFIRIDRGLIRTYPMKGTRADGPGAEELLLNDPKEAAEHATITDLLRNDLSMVAHDVAVTRYRYIDTLTTHKGQLLQTSTEITGTLPDDWESTLGDLLYKLLPAGSISGAPKEKTIEILREAETYDRGFYTGIAGYYAEGRLDSCVLIRFIESTPTGLVFKSGGGLTSQSCLEDEYSELNEKIYVPLS